MRMRPRKDYAERTGLLLLLHSIFTAEPGVAVQKARVGARDEEVLPGREDRGKSSRAKKGQKLQDRSER